MFNSLTENSSPESLLLETSLNDLTLKSTFSSTSTSSQTKSEILAEKLLERLAHEKFRISSECKSLRTQIEKFYT